MSGEKGPGAGEAAGLRVVVDAQIALAMFLAPRDDPAWGSPKRQLLRLLASASFHWLWSPDVISDYERGAVAAVEADERLARRAVFDRAGFELFLAALRLSPAVKISATTLRKARKADRAGPSRRGAGPGRRRLPGVRGGQGRASDNDGGFGDVP